MTTPAESERSASARFSTGPALRIAFFPDTFLPTLGGVAQTTSSIAGELAARGNEVTVFTVRSSGQKRHEQLSNGVGMFRYLALVLLCHKVDNPRSPPVGHALYHGPRGTPV